MYLYIHVPFCLRKCPYCDFLSVAADEALQGRYIKTLINEIRIQVRKAGVTDPLNSVYIGGGTPTALDGEQLRKIFIALREGFRILPDAEITVEANPGTLNKEKLSVLVSSGVNRLSIGVQSFNDRELKVLGRIHGSKEAEEAVDLARKAGFENISIDLIYGIPGQRLDSWKKTIKKAIELGPKHISAYELTPEKDTPLFELLKKGSLTLPGEDEVLDMYRHAVEAMSETGYVHYEISNYALPGYECRHNLNYWNRGEYLGLGAGAHSFLGGRRFSNTKDIAGYIRSVSEGVRPVENEEEVSPEAAIEEFIFLGLRKTKGISLTDAERYMDSKRLLHAAMEFIDAGLMEGKGGFLRLTKGGLPLSNPVVAGLLINIEARSPIRKKP